MVTSPLRSGKIALKDDMTNCGNFFLFKKKFPVAFVFFGGKK